MTDFTIELKINDKSKGIIVTEQLAKQCSEKDLVERVLRQLVKQFGYK